MLPIPFLGILGFFLPYKLPPKIVRLTSNFQTHPILKTLTLYQPKTINYTISNKDNNILIFRPMALLQRAKFN